MLCVLQLYQINVDSVRVETFSCCTETMFYFFHFHASSVEDITITYLLEYILSTLEQRERAFRRMSDGNGFGFLQQMS